MPFLNNDYPEYFVLGPLVFSPVTRDHIFDYYTAYLAAMGSPIALRAEEERAFEGEELVVLASDFLPHPHHQGLRRRLPPHPQDHQRPGRQIRHPHDRTGQRLDRSLPGL
jgi:hypothetical protein